MAPVVPDVMALPSLTLRAVRTVAVNVPMRRPLGTSARRMDTSPLVLIDVDTEEGITGRSYIFCYLPAVPGAVEAILTEAAKRVTGARVLPESIAADLARHFRLLGVRGLVTMALAGLDGACWDALAVAAGLPLAKLLGAECRPVRAYNSNGLSLMPVEPLAEEAAELVGEQFGAIKLRLGYSTLEEDVAAVHAVRRRVGSEVVVMADYNQALDLDEALRRGRALDGLGLAWIEEPIRHDDYGGAAALAQDLHTPIQIGENFDGLQAMADALEARALDYAMPDFARIGGVTGWMRAAALAQRAGVSVSSHLYPEVSVHLLSATPTCHWLEYVDWAAPVLRNALEIRGGVARPPETAGVGLDWNHEAVARYRMA